MSTQPKSPKGRLETRAEIRWGSEIGEKVRGLRAEAQITQDELVRRSGLSRATIQNYERGSGLEPSLEVLARLAVGLSVSLEELLPEQLMGRLALDILRKMDADRGKEMARLEAIVGTSSRRSRPARSTGSSKGRKRQVPIIPALFPAQAAA